MDRAIENKVRITTKLVLGFADDYRSIAAKVTHLQQAIADTMQIFL